MQIPAQNKAYSVSQTVLAEMQRLDSHSAFTLTWVLLPATSPERGELHSHFAAWGLSPLCMAICLVESV